VVVRKENKKVKNYGGSPKKTSQKKRKVKDKKDAGFLGNPKDMKEKRQRPLNQGYFYTLLLLTGAVKFLFLF